MCILELFWSVNDSWQQFSPNGHYTLLTSGQRQRLRPTQVHPSEIMTNINLFHQSHYRTFKAYYAEYVQRYLPSEFPTLLSYLSNKLLLRKRAIIVTIHDQLKNICQLEHYRLRSPINFLANLVAGLFAYCNQPTNPSLALQPHAFPVAWLIPNSPTLASPTTILLTRC
jgi:hypothetical protein